MADGYKVGNLEIAFEAVDKTSASFKDLAKNLNTIYKVIDKIANADLSPFVANMQKVRKAFSPLLKNISGAGDGIIALNQAIQKVGVSKLSKVAQEFVNIRKTVEDTESTVVETNAKINEGNNLLKKTFTSLVAINAGTAGYNWTGDYALQVKEAVTFTEEYRQALIRLLEQMILSRKVYDENANGMNKLASQWKNLYANVIQYGNQYGEGFVGRANEELAKLQQQYFQMRTVVDDTNNAFREMEEIYKRSRMSAEELTIEEYRQVEASRKQRIEFLEAALALGKAGENTETYKQELAELKGELDKIEKSTKKGTNGFKKFLKSLGRIALYRTIRRALQLITQSITETIQEFAKLDDNVNNTMSSITSSLQIIKLSFGSLFLPLLEMVAPILQQIAQAFAGLANMISQATASGDTYWAINSEAMQDYREQLEKTTGSLASFDKFNTLNNKQQTSFLEERQIDKSNGKLQNTKEILNTIKETISLISDIVLTIGKDVFEIIGDLLPIINDILSPIIDVIKELWNNILKPIWKNIKYSIQFLIAIIKGDLSEAIKKFLPNAVIAGINMILGLIDSLVNVFIIQLNSFTQALSKLWTWTGLPAIPEITWRLNIPKISYLANGGMPDRGTLFVAGEAGAEAVYNTPSGQSGVANISQLKSAFYQALVEWSRQSGDNNISVTLNLDGEEVYRNVTNHAQRRGKVWANA